MRNRDSRTINCCRKIKKLSSRLAEAKREFKRYKDPKVSKLITKEIIDLKKDIAWMFLDCGEYRKAIVLYKELSWKSEGETKYLGMGRALTEMGDDAEAEKLLAKGLKRFPKSAPLLVGMGNIYHRAADYITSLRFFERALSIDQTNNLIHFSKANALYGIGHYEDAYSIYRTLTINDPDEPLFLIQFGYCCLQLNDPEDAAKCFKSLMDVGFSDSNAYNGLFWAYYDMGFKNDAIETAVRGIKKCPDADLYSDLGLAYYEQDWLQEARDTVREGLRKFPQDKDLIEILETIEDDIDDPDDDNKRKILEMVRLVALSAILRTIKKNRRI